MTSYHWSTIGLVSLQPPHVFYQMKHPRKPETTTDDPGPPLSFPEFSQGPDVLLTREVSPVRRRCVYYRDSQAWICESWRRGKNMNPKHILIDYPKL